jgi:hypothetical protein
VVRSASEYFGDKIKWKERVQRKVDRIKEAQAQEEARH